MLKFTKSFESHVRLLDDSLVKSKGIEIHNLTYENNELRISPARNQPFNLSNNNYAITNIQEPHTSQLETVSSAISDISAVAQITDEYGYEWITTADGKDWHRTQGSNDDWTEFSKPTQCLNQVYFRCMPVFLMRL